MIYNCVSLPSTFKFHAIYWSSDSVYIYKHQWSYQLKSTTDFEICIEVLRRIPQSITLCSLQFEDKRPSVDLYESIRRCEPRYVKSEINRKKLNCCLAGFLRFSGKREARSAARYRCKCKWYKFYNVMAEYAMRLQYFISSLSNAQKTR